MTLREKIADIILDCRDPKRAYQGADVILALFEDTIKDAERLRLLAVGTDENNPGPMLCDGFADIDIHEQATIYASTLGREEPNADDYLAAWRDACDAAKGTE